MSKFRTVKSISEISAEAWDGLARATGAAANPLISHAFLQAMEQSGCTSMRTGWKPSHIILEEHKAAAPCYLKSHSMGEYVFDHVWADAYARAGGDYYPKLQVSVPFSPVPGPRLLAATPEHRKALAKALIEHCNALGASSVHITFMREEEATDAEAAGFLLRKDIQFHWQNEGFKSFDDFLATLSSSKRKNIRKERKAVAEAGITFELATGNDLTTEHWDHFFACYMDTGSRKWGSPYLNRKFFALLGETMAEQTLLVLAKRDDKYIAGALNMIGGDTLYGRNWGCLEHHDFLHFECCYYRAIDFAIAHGLKTVEAGAQGEHKLVRGYRPVQTTSAHYLAHPGLRRAVADFLKREREAVGLHQEELAAHLPFRHEQD